MNPLAAIPSEPAATRSLLDRIAELLHANTPLYDPWGRVLAIFALFACAFLISRTASRVASFVLTRHDRRHREGESTLPLAQLKRRETLVGVVRTTVSYVTFASAAVLSLAALVGGLDQLGALAGAGFLLVIGAFVVNRLLADVLSGLAIVAERWYSVGDTIALPTFDVQGIVEDVSLRRTRLRALNGEIVHISNGQIAAVRMLPRGVKELSIELYVSDAAAAAVVLEAALALLPVGATTLVRRPQIAETEQLTESLARISLRASVAPGREWLVEELLPKLLKEQAPESLIVHGPIVLAVDEKAEESYARAQHRRRRKPR